MKHTFEYLEKFNAKVHRLIYENKLGSLFQTSFTVIISFCSVHELLSSLRNNCQDCFHIGLLRLLVGVGEREGLAGGNIFLFLVINLLV